jgi:hypothetical protein
MLLLFGFIGYLTDLRDSSSLKMIAELYEHNQSKATDLVERASLACLPELKGLVSTKARKVVPQLVIAGLTKMGDSGNVLDEMENDEAFNDIIKPAWDVAPVKDLAILNQALKKMNAWGSKFPNCIGREGSAIYAQDESKRTRDRSSSAQVPGA